MELAIAGGGTGGHLYPGLAVAAAVKRANPQAKITFYGTRRGIESRVLPGTGYGIRYISAQGFLGKNRTAQFFFPLYMMSGVIQSLFYLSKCRPDVILGTGGYVSAPPVMAAWILRIPISLLALDVMPSQAVRFLARFADRIYGGFPECSNYLDKSSRVLFTGNPIRPEIGNIPREKGVEKFDLNGNKRTILVFGGSQGAHSINLAMLEVLKMLDQNGKLKDLQVIFQTGKNDREQISEAVKQYSAGIKVLAYIDQMPYALAAADLVISRSGAGISETLACGLPSILIPYPHAASNHQEYNARSLEKAGAAEMILDQDMNGQVLAEKISDILFDQKKYDLMAQAAKTLARPEAADKIADNIIRMTGKQCSEK
ncbi:MAG: undecaprenyldiphospho-muramoylpentapeptide beta-N-acetylglucosaminyltransferase [Candidatus Edwardsbacteria bacterium]|nr:undecaprenyldiphospho-muramoylpentapeptide beta-N-acetylglucosaminyltransferase [Candidatus Edwardsbacteria bacterium]